MWLETLGTKINNLSYSGTHPQGQLKKLIEVARGKNFSPPEGYRGALPTEEPPWEVVNTLRFVPAEIIAVDGSQIYPDPAEPLPWAYAHAMVTRPPSRYLSRFLSPSELLEAEAAAGRKLIDSVRFSLELQLAAQSAEQWGRKAEVLLDGPILPPGRTSHTRKGLGKEILDGALAAMDQAIDEGGVIAGFTPNGHARYMASLLLATVGEENEKRRLPLIDRKVIRSLIKPGQRTALYRRRALDGREVYFFYTPQGRVEFPFKPSTKVVNQVWGSVEGGYPVELTAAHHMAVIPHRTASYLKAVVRGNLREGDASQQPDQGEVCPTGYSEKRLAKRRADFR